MIITDMDGTLLDDDKNINKEFHKVYTALREKGIKFVVASGRHYSEMHKYFKPKYDDMIYIAENGGQIIYEDKEIFSSSMDLDYVFKIAEDAIRIEGVDIILSGEENIYLYNFRNKPVKDLRDFYFKFKVLDNPSDLKENIYKVSVYNENGSDFLAHKEIYDNWEDKLHVTSSAFVWTDIQNKGVNKGVAVNILKDRFEIKDDEIMVFGDYNNDIEMLKLAHHSYAMENASEEIKGIANFMAKSNNDNGVLEAIKNIVLV